MVTRREFLGCSVAAFAAAAAPNVFARTQASGERALGFYNTHTGEQLKTTYWSDGQYLQQELNAINWILRDYRCGELTDIDPQLLDLLHVLQVSTGHFDNFEVISAYRSTASNAYLRKAGTGVAKRSLHMQGKAIDIRLPGVELKHLRQAALQLRAGGVGYYPDSNFIHVDTGRPRYW